MEFNPADHIWLHTIILILPPGLSHKLAQSWIGPYEIIVKISAIENYLNLPPELAIYDAFHDCLLKPNYGPVLIILPLSLLLILMLLSMK